MIMIINRQVIVVEKKVGEYTDKNGSLRNYCIVQLTTDNEDDGIMQCSVDIRKVDINNIKKFGKYTMLIDIPNIINEKSRYVVKGVIGEK